MCRPVGDANLQVSSAALLSVSGACTYAVISYNKSSLQQVSIAVGAENTDITVLHNIVKSTQSVKCLSGEQMLILGDILDINGSVTLLHDVSELAIE